MPDTTTRQYIVAQISAQVDRSGLPTTADIGHFKPVTEYNCQHHDHLAQPQLSRGAGCWSFEPDCILCAGWRELSAIFQRRKRLHLKVLWAGTLQFWLETSTYWHYLSSRPLRRVVLQFLMVPIPKNCVFSNGTISAIHLSQRSNHN